MKIRTVFFWCHLVAGVTAGIVILIMSVTGVAITYERQMTERIDGPPPVAVPEGGVRKSTDELLAAHGIDRAQLTTIGLNSDPTKPVIVRIKDRGAVYLDPYRGTALEVAKPVIGPFFRKMTDWHRWLGRDGEGRAVGRVITGGSNVIFLFIVASGFYLWWPRRWTRQAVRAVTVFNPRLSGKARDFNWHHVIGFWCAPVLFIIVLSAMFISYRWPAALLNRIFDDAAPPLAATKPSGEPVPVAYEAVWNAARAQAPGWRTLTMTLPPAGDSIVRVSVAMSDVRRPTDRAQLTLGATTGAVLTWQPYDSLTRTRRVQGWMRFLHTGEALGAAGQTVAGIASLGGVFLVWTGLMLTWRRFIGWRRRIRRPLGAADTTPEIEESVPAMAMETRTD